MKIKFRKREIARGSGSLWSKNSNWNFITILNQSLIQEFLNQTLIQNKKFLVKCFPLYIKCHDVEMTCTAVHYET